MKSLALCPRPHCPIVLSCLLFVAAGCAAPATRRPPQLDVDHGTISVTVYQRETRVIPGSDGLIKVDLGDITGQRVLVSILPVSRRDPLLDRREMRQNDFAEFTHGDRRYVVALERLVNLPVGNDYATLTFMTPATLPEWQIERLLDRLAASNVSFVHNDIECDGPNAALYLREKRELLGVHPRTIDEFIDHVATRSVQSGQPYQFKLPDGTIIDAAVWLRQQLAPPEQPRGVRSAGERRD